MLCNLYFIFHWMPCMSNLSFFIIYKEPTRCNFGQYCFLLTTASTLYMFRTLSVPIIRSTENCSKTGACRGSGWCTSSKDVQGRSTTLFHSRIRIALVSTTVFTKIKLLLISLSTGYVNGLTSDYRAFDVRDMCFKIRYYTRSCMKRMHIHLLVICAYVMTTEYSAVLRAMCRTEGQHQP